MFAIIRRGFTFPASSRQHGSTGKYEAETPEWPLNVSSVHTDCNLGVCIWKKWPCSRENEVKMQNCQQISRADSIQRQMLGMVLPTPHNVLLFYTPTSIYTFVNLRADQVLPLFVTTLHICHQPVLHRKSWSLTLLNDHFRTTWRVGELQMWSYAEALEGKTGPKRANIASWPSFLCVQCTQA